MKPCENAMLYFYGELTEADRAAFQAHLPACAACQAELHMLAQTRQALEAPAAPRAVVDALFAKTTRKKSWFFSWKTAFASAALAAVGAVMVLNAALPGPTVYDRQEVLAYLSEHLDEDYMTFAAELDELEEDF